MTKAEYIKMFRGQWKVSWATALVKAGWPDPQARRMADFLVGELPEVPTWDEMVVPPSGLEPELR
ncbi:hypothetical protein [Mesorhizobium sp. M0767]|uniref:hypothetical protein n=1 Tax=Mesorhizobium sp. M0767 TaxID=2956995 RepID=UPI00333B7486